MHFRSFLRSCTASIVTAYQRLDEKKMILLTMSANVAILFLLLLHDYLVLGEELFCEKFNFRTCHAENKTECITKEKCPASSEEARSHCFTYWEYDIKMKTANIQMMGCFVTRNIYNNVDCYNQKSHCIQKTIRDSKSEMYFCCCSGNLCSKNLTNSYFLEQRVQLLHTDVQIKNNPMWRVDHVTSVMAIMLAFIIVLSIGICICENLINDNCRKVDNANEQQSKLEAGEGSRQEAIEVEFKLTKVDEIDSLNTINADLVEKLAEGRFGAVWRARLDDEDLAIKVFPLRYQQSWKSELEIFRLPFMEHDHLLQYVGARRRGDNLDAELWLVTPYHELGSLSDYLAENTLTCEQMFSIATSMTSGLKHLHQEVGQPSGDLPDGYKPSVAHRDFKSRNVLLSVSKSGELRACVADFGLALTFRPDVRNLRHGRVGTLRYMAPEVLQGAISFNRASFLAIDMYACGLVLWELASRCRVEQDALVDDYSLPFEKEVGSQPTLEEMQTCVVEEQRRPSIPESWRNHSRLALICETMEECWDKDADARLSSSCVFDRMSSWREESVSE